jgi:outer membrane receptor protein involved in Fe transport
MHKKYFQSAQVLLVALFFMGTLALRAQSNLGTIQGTVSDSTGAAVVDAQITVTNTGTNAVQQSRTNNQGIYVVPFVQPGNYTVTAAQSGFETASHTGITLHVDDSLAIDFNLKVGSTSAAVTVTAAGLLINTSNASLGQVIDNQRIVDLPLVDRDPVSLAGLSAGVVPVPPSVNIHQGDNTPSINGAANFTSEVMVDGVPDTTPGNSGLNNFLIFTPTVDTVAEFKVETNALSAEYGRYNGGVINIILKSGTNTVHGSAYEFIQNSVADANNFFNNRAGIPLAALKQNQFGFTLGGPIVIPHVYDGRNKTFFFGDYEGFRETVASPTSFTVPTALEREGNFSQTLSSSGQLITIYDPASVTTVNGVTQRTAFPGNIIPASRLDPVALQLQKYFPLPNNNNLTSNYVVSPSARNVDNTGDVRLDRHFGDRDQAFMRLSLEYPFTGSANYYGNIGNYGNPPLTQTRQAGTIQNTFTVSPTLIFEVSYGIVHQYGTRTAWSNGFDITSLGFDPSFAAGQQVKALPYITLTGMSGIGNASQNYSTQLNHTVVGSLTKISGRHSIQVGADFRTYFINQLQNTQAEGNLSFTSTYTQGPNPLQASAVAGLAYADFILGIPGGSIASQPAIASKSSYLAEFVQDDWRVNDKLTLNLGLRYDINFPRTERYNRMSIFDLGATSPIAGQVLGFPNLKGAMTFAGPGHRAYAPTDYNNVAPRVGLAYQLKPDTVVRLAYGIVYGLSPTDASGPSGGFTDGFTGSTAINTSLNGITPIISLANPFPGGINPQATGSQLNASTDLGQSMSSVNIGQVTPYMQNWNFSIQQSYRNNLLFTVAYAANKGTKLPYNAPININSLTTAQFEEGAVNNELVPNPFYGVITNQSSILSKPTVSRGQLLQPYPQYTTMNAVYATLGDSSYNSFQATVEKRLSNGFSVLGAFTIAKLIDDTSASSAGAVISTIQDPTNLRSERSIDPQDLSKRLVISGVWALPFGRGGMLFTDINRAGNALIGGWHLNGIISFESGIPLVMTSIGQAGLRPNVVKPTEPLSGPIVPRLNKYFDTSEYAVPAAFTYGNSPPTAPNLRGPGMANYDLSLFKNFPIVERLQGEFRIEAFNAFNRVQFGQPGTQAGTTSFGVISTQANQPRQLQAAFKLLF